MKSNEKSSLQTTQQFMGIESINTTRLITLKSWQADITTHPVSKTWVIEKANKRSYLQHRISIQNLQIWHAFRSIPNDVDLILENGTSIPIFAGNWTPDTLANYLTSKMTGTTVAYDPYQFQFRFCPPVSIDPTSTANPYLGFPTGVKIESTNRSAFPPVSLQGPTCINVWTNFTMNNIPVSQLLQTIPINVEYGKNIFFSNYDNSMSTLCLESDITNITVTLCDENDNRLEYPEGLQWTITLALQSTIPEGFAPLEM